MAESDDRAEILGISSRLNLKAQVAKLRQDRERLHSWWQHFSQVHDALRCSVTEELSRLSQIVHAQRVETHQTRAYEIGGDGIVGQHDLSEISRRAMCGQFIHTSGLSL